MMMAIPSARRDIFLFVLEAPPRRFGHYFCFAVPPRHCPLLFDVVGHRRAAAMGASDDVTNESL